MQFEHLGLKAELLRAIESQGYSTPTPIQAQAIPVVLDGRDLLAGAQTGTGKTAAFALPILQLLNECARRYPDKRKAPRALVLTPTRELAAQVAESVSTYGQHLSMRSTVVFGGVGINPQKDALHRGVDILVATPGRLLDHAAQRTVDLSAVEILVLDEADRMLDMGFIHDIRKVLALLPQRRQNLLFSATYSAEIKRLADRLLHQPELLEIARRGVAAESVTQHVYRVEKRAKRDLLVHLIKAGHWYQVLVFTRTKHGANRLAEQLNRAGVGASAIHGNKSQNARTQALARFKDGVTQVLVATDIAARGLDIDRLSHVVNYELPNEPDSYVHRIGRTGRAGETGAALSLVDDEELKLLGDIQRLLRKEIPVLPLPAFETCTSTADTTPGSQTQPRGRRSTNAGAGPSNPGGSRRKHRARNRQRAAGGSPR